MIEFFILRAFYRKLAAIAESKNQPRSLGWLGVILWITGEVVGFAIAGPGADGSGYLAALLCAAGGAAVAFLILTVLAPLPPADFPTASIHRGD